MNKTEKVLDDRIPDFQGRTIFVYLAGMSVEHGQYLDDPHIEKLCGRYFLMGTAPSNVKMSGHQFCIAWDRVDAYIVADSLDVFMKALQNTDGEA